MNSVSISQLKMNPSAVFGMAADYPVAVDSRNKRTGYIVGSRLFENMVEWMEDMEDISVVKKSEYPKGKKVSDLRVELGL